MRIRISTTLTKLGENLVNTSSDLVADGSRAAAPLDENGGLTDDPASCLTPRSQVVRGNLQGKRSGSHSYVYCFR
jgi:hypothetical protein